MYMVVHGGMPGGLVASMRYRGEDYLHFYCSGNEGIVREDIEKDLAGLEYIPVPYNLEEEDKMIYLNDLARRIALREGGVREVDIAQIKQVMKILLEELGKFDNDEIVALVDNYR